MATRRLCRRSSGVVGARRHSVTPRPRARGEVVVAAAGCGGGRWRWRWRWWGRWGAYGERQSIVIARRRGERRWACGGEGKVVVRERLGVGGGRRSARGAEAGRERRRHFWKASAGWVRWSLSSSLLGGDRPEPGVPAARLLNLRTGDGSSFSASLPLPQWSMGMVSIGLLQ